MSPPATPAQLRQAYRNQEFQNVSMTRGQCPLMQKEVAIFPVRYALDESPEKGSAQGNEGSVCAFAHRLDVDHAIEKLGGHSFLSKQVCALAEQQLRALLFGGADVVQNLIGFADVVRVVDVRR